MPRLHHPRRQSVIPAFLPVLFARLLVCGVGYCWEWERRRVFCCVQLHSVEAHAVLVSFWISGREGWSRGDFPGAAVGGAPGVLCRVGVAWCSASRCLGAVRLDGHAHLAVWGGSAQVRVREDSGMREHVQGAGSLPPGWGDLGLDGRPLKAQAGFSLDCFFQHYTLGG